MVIFYFAKLQPNLLTLTHSHLAMFITETLYSSYCTFKVLLECDRLRNYCLFNGLTSQMCQNNPQMTTGSEFVSIILQKIINQILVI